MGQFHAVMLRVERTSVEFVAVNVNEGIACVCECVRELIHLSPTASESAFGSFKFDFLLERNGLIGVGFIAEVMEIF